MIGDPKLMTEHLTEFVEDIADQFAREPAAALARFSSANIPAARWQELLDGTGKPMSLLEASDLGLWMGPSLAFWQNLWRINNPESTIAKKYKGRGGTA